MIPIPVKSESPELDMRSGSAGSWSAPRAGRVFRRTGFAALTVLALAVAGCGGGSAPSSNSGSPNPGTAHAGGTYTILANSAFGVADPAQNYTLQEWQLLIDTHDGLVQFERVGGTRRHQDRARPGHGAPDADRRRQDLPVPHQDRDQVLQRPGHEAERLRQDVRAAVHRAGADHVLLRHRGRVRVQHQGMRPVQGRGRRRPEQHADLPPDGPGSRVHRQAGPAVRLRGPGQHVVQAHRQQRAARHRAVHVAVVQPQLRGRPGPQQVLPRLERPGSAGRIPRQDRREVRADRLGRGHGGRERPGRRGVRR